MLHATKRKATKIPEPLSSKMAKMTEADPIYEDETSDSHQQDLFEEYLDTHRDLDGEEDGRQGDDSGLDENSASTSWPWRKGGGRKVSPIWNHYRINDADPKYAQCLHCGKRVSRGSTIPSKMTNSIINYHFTKHLPNIDINTKPEAELFISSVKRNISATEEASN